MWDERKDGLTRNLTTELSRRMAEALYTAGPEPTHMESSLRDATAMSRSIARPCGFPLFCFGHRHLATAALLLRLGYAKT